MTNLHCIKLRHIPSRSEEVQLIVGSWDARAGDQTKKKKKPKKIFLLQWSMGRLHSTRPRQTKRIVAWNYVLYATAVCPIPKVSQWNM